MASTKTKKKKTPPANFKAYTPIIKIPEGQIPKVDIESINKQLAEKEKENA